MIILFYYYNNIICIRMIGIVRILIIDITNYIVNARISIFLIILLHFFLNLL